MPKRVSNRDFDLSKFSFAFSISALISCTCALYSFCFARACDLVSKSSSFFSFITEPDFSSTLAFREATAALQAEISCNVSVDFSCIFGISVSNFLRIISLLSASSKSALVSSYSFFNSPFCKLTFSMIFSLVSKSFSAFTFTF